MHDTMSNHPVDDFDAAWQIVGQQYQSAILVTAALIKLSGAGEWPVEVERLATASGGPVDEMLALAQQFLKVKIQDGLVHLDLSVAAHPHAIASRSVRARLMRTGAHRTSFGRHCLPISPSTQRRPARRRVPRFESISPQTASSGWNRPARSSR
jgi:hypothetical protein